MFLEPDIPRRDAFTAPVPDTVLVVDDSRAQRRLLTTFLTKMGVRVLAAPSAEVALTICHLERPALIVSDWVMPGMDGLEFCRALRALEGERYGYFILQTSNDEKHEVARGLDAGADDFLTKPVNATELRARLRAGQRILRMQRELTEKNRLVSATLDRMKALHAGIDRDLVEAQKLQQALVPDRHRRFHGVDVSLLLRPAGRVGGDLVGMFEVNEDEFGVFAIDVSGHGIASALMTARLAAYFTGSGPGKNIAIGRDAAGRPVMRPPCQVAAYLNDLMLNELQTEQYLTMVLARVEPGRGRVTLTQAGHPHPIVRRADGRTELAGQAGMPVGLLPGARFAETVLHLAPGDRLFVGSDGISECSCDAGRLLGDAGVADLLRRHSALKGEAFFDAVLETLSAISRREDFADDISALLLDFG